MEASSLSSHIVHAHAMNAYKGVVV